MKKYAKYALLMGICTLLFLISCDKDDGNVMLPDSHLTFDLMLNVPDDDGDDDSDSTKIRDWDKHRHNDSD